MTGGLHVVGLRQRCVQALCKRYAEAPDDPNDEARQSRIRLKILSFFRQWVDKQYHDWEEFGQMLDKYRDWLTRDVMGAQEKVARQLLDAADKKTQRARGKVCVWSRFDDGGGVLTVAKQIGHREPVRRAGAQTHSSAGCACACVQRGAVTADVCAAGFSRVTELDPTELARQMCLVESRLFQAIKPKVRRSGRVWFVLG